MLENQLGLQSVWLLAGTWQVRVREQLGFTAVSCHTVPAALCCISCCSWLPCCCQLCCSCTHLLSRAA